VSGRPGQIALVGSGEFLPAMAEVDLALLARTPARGRRPRVAVIPTASAEDAPGTFERWGELGTAHFAALGAEVLVADIRTPSDARDAARVALLAGCDLYYFSGGMPDLLVDVFVDSPAWAAIADAHARGAAVAGCSAGAMAVGPYSARVRAMMAGGPPSWSPALRLLRHICTFPHFNRRREFVDDATFFEWLSAAPAGAVAVGVDEGVALVGGGDEQWSVRGREDGGVSVFAADGSFTVYRVGERVRIGGSR
jgi:cyanophycinase-like exopeptidase